VDYRHHDRESILAAVFEIVSSSAKTMIRMEAGTFSVLHVATALSWRGGEQQVAYLVEELRLRHVKQWVLCSQGSAMESYCVNNGIPFFSTRKRSSFDISFASRLASICRTNEVDIVHAHDSHAHTFAVLSAVLFRNKSRVVVSRRVDFAVGGNPFSKFKYNHSCIARIICVSDKIKEITSGAVNDKSKLVTIHSGIDVSRFRGKVNAGILHRQYFLPSHIKIVGNVSALAPHKDYRTFLNVVDILKDVLPDTVYFIIGEGPERGSIESYIEKHKLQQQVYLTGFRSDIADIMPELDLMLMTSETEGLGTTILDAFACAVPVVATAAGGIPELVIHEKTGLLGAIGDAQGLAAHVRHLLRDEQLLTRLVNGAAKHLQDFSREATSMKTMKEYAAVAGTAL
jgi:L-malate glycosyltransferase